MEVIFLGTGTSQGIPVIGCTCTTCQSENPHDKRLRVAILLRKGEQQILIDAGPDFRQQMLRADIDDLQAILLTHEHNDHIIGMDDVRPFIFRSRRPMPVYASERVAQELRTRFAYAFQANPYPGAPRFQIHTTDDSDNFKVAGLDFTIIHFRHGHLPVQGYRSGGFAYLTDIKTIDEEEIKKLANLDTLVISALHREEHHSHLNLEEALLLIEKIGPRRAFLTHLSHSMGPHCDVEQLLPPHVQIAYDQLVLSLPDE